MAQANVKLTVDATNATQALKGVQNQTNQLQKAFGGLKTAFVGIGFTVLAKQTISTTANFKTLQLRMKGLTSEYGEFAQVQELVTKAQNKFNLSIIEATKSVTDIFARLRPLGIELKDIETAFMGFNTLAVAAGLNANEMNAAFTQLAQGLGSGQLQGDEFRSIAEQIPQLLSAISKETGIAEGKLKSFASKGLLKTDIIIRALANSTEEYQDVVDEIINNSPEAAFKSLSNAVLELQLTLGDKLIPALADGAVALASFVEGFTNFIESEQGQVALIITGVVLATKALGAAIAFATPAVIALKTNLATMSIAAAAANGKLGASATLSFAAAGGFTKAAIAASGLKIALAKLGIGLVVIALGQLVANLMAASNAQKKLNEIIEKGSVADIKEQIDKANESIDKFKKRFDFFEKKGFKALAEGELENIKDAKELIIELEEALEKAQARALTKEFERTKKTLEDKNKQLQKIIERSKIETEEGKKQFDLEQRRLELIEKFGEEKAEAILQQEEDNRELEKGVEIIKKQEEAAKALDRKFEQIGKSIEDGIVQNLADAVEGTQTLAEAAVNVLNQLKRKLIEVAIQNAISGLNIGGQVGDFFEDVFKAEGGPVNRGRPYIVGERGPEMFVPNTSGSIVPNNSLGGGGASVVNNISVSVDASGSAVSGSDASASELGQQIAIAIQSELINQKRAGGLLAR